MRTLLLLAAGMCLFVSPVCVPSLRAQSSTTGALTVAVTDPSSAIVAGATLVLENVATGQQRTEVTGSQGTYTFPLLPVGDYKVTISAPGFKSVQLPSVTISVTETRVVKHSLELGTSQQEVTVVSEAQAVQTDTAALGSVVTGSTITALPLVTRNYTQILSLSPGAISDVVNAGTIGHGSPAIYVNGMAGNGNSYQMDGADITSLSSGTTNDLNFGTIAIPNPDTLQEFKVQTSMYDASYGRNAGGSVNVVTKSGTNQFHGALFEFLRNDAFNANAFFRNRNGQARPVLKQNQYGFTFGGPLIKKDKLFFFSSYQKTDQVNGLDSTALSSVTLPPQLTNSRTRADLGKAFCPQNNPAGSTFANTRFGGVQVACDGSNINPVALTLLNYKFPDGSLMIPTPQRIVNAGTPEAFGSSVFSVPATYVEDQFLGNVDYLLSSKHTLSGRYFYAISPQFVPFKCNPCVPNGSSGIHLTGNNNVLGRLTSVLTNRVVNEARFSSVYLRASNRSLDPLTSPEVGITPAVPTFPLIPVITIPGLFGFGGAQNNGEKQANRTVQWSDQVSWVQGRHNIRIGYQGERFYWDARVFALARGSLSFQSFPDFLLGMSAMQNGSAFSNVGTASAFVGTPSLNLKANSSTAFVQDDFKVNSRLTFNLGLRWEYMGLPYDSPKGNTFNTDWDQFLTVPIPPASGTYAGLTMPQNYPGKLPNGVLRRPGNVQLTNGSPLHNYAPRFGVAWQPDNSGRLVIRAGYGWFFTRVTFQEPQASACCGPPQVLAYNLSGVTNANATFQTPFPPTPPADPSIPPASTNSLSGGPVGFTPYLRTLTSSVNFAFGIDPKQIPPLVQTYNVNVQYALKPSLTLEVGYINSRVFRLASFKFYNVPQLATASNPVNCGLPTGCISTNTAANAPLRVPVIGLAPGGVKLQGNYGNSQHHGLQIDLRKRFSRGLQFGTAYTFSKTMNDVLGTFQEQRNFGGSSNINNPEFDRRGRWGVADFNRTHRLIANFAYELPQFRNNRGFAGKSLSGWGLSGVMTIQSGTPLTVTDPTGGAAYGFVGGTALAQFCPGVTHADTVTSGDLGSRLNGFFNRSAFCPIPIVGAINGVGGATGYGNSGRSFATGPGQNNWDFSLNKTTRVGGLREDARLEFRAEFFNIFNHSQFSNPGTALNTGAFGVINSTSVAPRIIQLALKYVF